MCKHCQLQEREQSIRDDGRKTGTCCEPLTIVYLYIDCAVAYGLNRNATLVGRFSLWCLLNH
jgi:hypothetical protein